MKFYWLILGVLTVWRITHFLQAENGPADVVVRLRRTIGNGFWGKLMDCFYCLSLWVAAPVAWALGTEWLERSTLWLALSAGAILLERIGNGESDMPMASYYEEEEVDDVLLRKSEKTTPDKSDVPASS